jgi:hypothetical protein
VPPGLAADLLAVATSSLPDGVRPDLFAAPVDVPRPRRPRTAG